ncbi:MAG: CDP-glycerol glycerophosphotransferase family protein [Simkaniaceae bacterium]|nr:CDP-glycerol glycerophosphotransferase family protein [Simkaniaceae bacterium]
MSADSKSASLLSGDYAVNHIDHLAPIAHIMGGPVIVDTPFLQKTMREYYPQVASIHVPFHQQILEILALGYERVFFSVAPYRKDLAPVMETFFGRAPQFWYCPHGNSDKTLKHYGLQHYALTYGEQMERRLRVEGHGRHLKGHVRTGNIRRAFYESFRAFYDDLAERLLFSRFAERQTTYLYAPTWNDFDRSTSLFEVAPSLLEQLPDSINLIVKLHPWLEHHHPGDVHGLKARFEEKPNVIVLSRSPFLFSLLGRVDLYLGDFSSIGYEFLPYDRPMFFFDPEVRIRQRETPLLACGEVIGKEHYHDIFSYIEHAIARQGRFSSLRENLYEEAFDGSISLHSIKKSILEYGC